ncbi:MAG: AMP-binding protein, partial [Pseudobutyrivibrio sp.]|nr:AMP-binding protein [Pseudobutyrivibrio sp.]
MKKKSANFLIEVDKMTIERMKLIAKNMKLDFEDTLLSLFSKVALRWFKEQKLDVEIMRNLEDKCNSIRFSNDLYLGFYEQVKNLEHIDSESASPSVIIEKIIMGEDLLIEWRSNSAQLNSTMCEDIGTSFCSLIDSISKDTSMWKEYIEVPLLEKDWKLIQSVNQTDRQFEYKSLKSILEDSIRKNRNRTAIISGEKRYTYSDFEKEVCKVKQYLHRNNIVRNQSVALFLDKDERQQIAIVGTILAGAVFVPIDTNNPLDRTVQCLEECDAKVLITSDERLAEFQKVNTPIVTIDSILQNEPSGYIDDIIVEDPSPNDIFDIVFTSGSTGKPKGVISEQLGMTNHFLCTEEMLSITSQDSILALTNYSHDVSFYESFGMFLYGGKVIIPSKEHQGAPHCWFDYMKRHEITFWFSVPTIMEMMLFAIAHEKQIEKLEHFRIAIIGGEFMPPDLFKRLKKIAPDIKLFNLGGATETSVFNLMHLITEDDLKRGLIPYGNPIWNTKYWILNDNLEIMPTDCVGMICNSGINIARGYLDDGATNKSFINPSTLDERIYITGDLGRLSSDGVFEIVGREDQQVKINGERIEISEISSTIAQYDSVKECVGLVINDTVLGNESRIAAVLTLHGGCDSFEVDNIKEHAKRKLPKYMVPTIWKVMDKLPQTHNNKIDNKLLIKMCREELNANYDIDDGEGIETNIIKICSGILETKTLDVHANFLEYGGHSLLIIKLLQAIRDTFKVDISFVEFYEEPTIEFLIRKVKERESLVGEEDFSHNFVEEKDKRYDTFPMNDMQMSYYLGQTETRLGKTPTHMYMAIDGGNLEVDRFQWSLNRLIKRHEALRAIVCGDGEQCILENVPEYVVETIDISSLSEAKKQEFFEENAKEMLYQVNDLKSFPNFNVKAIKTSRASFTICAVINCVMVDGGSISVLEDDLIRIYNGEKLEPIEISLRDYTNNVLRIKETKQYKKSMDYWMSRIDTIPDAPALNVSLIEKNDVSSKVYHNKTFIEKEIYQRFTENTRKHHITAVTGQILAYALVLSRWSGSLHFTINIPSFNRVFLHDDVPNLVGEFGSLLFLEVNILKEDSLKVLGKKIQRQFIEDLDHHHVTGVDVLRNYAEQGRQWNIPVVFTSVTAQDDRSMSRSDHEMLDWMTQSSKVWIDCIATEKAGGLEFVWDSCEGILDKKQISEMFEAFKKEIINLSDPEAWEKNILESVPAPNQNLVEKLNQTEKEWETQPQLLHYGFYKNAVKNPQKTACITSGERVSYGRVHELASNVAA